MEPTTQDVEQERAAFEAWANRPQGMGRTYRDTEPGYEDEYADSHTQLAWKAWQAARRHSATQLAALTEKLAAAEANLTTLAEQVSDQREAAYTYGDFSKEAVQIAFDGVLDAIRELPSDRTALDTMLAEARREERSALGKKLRNDLTTFDPHWSGNGMQRGGDYVLLSQVLEMLSALPDTPQAGQKEQP